MCIRDRTEDETQATAEVVWTGTPLEGYVNRGIANVEDNLNIREAADEGSSLVGKRRKNAACEVLGYEGEWAHIQSGEVEGYVKYEYLYTGPEAIDLAFQLGQTFAKVTTDALYAVAYTHLAMRRLQPCVCAARIPRISRSW